MNRSLIAFILCFTLLFSLVSCKTEKEVQEPKNDAGDATGTSVGSEEPLTPLPEPQDEEPQATRVSFLAGGDNLIHNGIYEQASRNAGGVGKGCTMDSAYDFAPFYADLKPLVSSVDIAFLNQETLVSGAPEKMPSNYPQFNTPAALGDTMVELGFDVVNVANNHMLDLGGSGLENSIKYWRSKSGITQVGGYLSQDDYSEIRVVEKNGVRIAFLAYAEDPVNSGGTASLTTEFYHNYSSRFLCVPVMDEAQMKEQIEKARQVSDFVVVALHWGVENTANLTNTQKRYAKLCAELGVDLVVGSHPHVIQSMEWLESPDRMSKTLVLYSLGNMFSLMQTTPDNLLGGLITLDFVMDAEGRRLENVEFVPIVTHCNTSYRTMQVYFLEDYTAELYQSHYIHRYHTTTVSDFYDTLRRVIPREFLKTETT